MFVADFVSTNSSYWTWKQQICRKFCFDKFIILNMKTTNLSQILFDRIVIFIMKTIHCIWNESVSNLSQILLRRIRYIEYKNSKSVANFNQTKFIILIMKTANLSQILWQVWHRKIRDIDHRNNNFVTDLWQSLFWQTRYIQNETLNLWRICDRFCSMNFVSSKMRQQFCDKFVADSICFMNFFISNIKTTNRTQILFRKFRYIDYINNKFVTHLWHNVFQRNSYTIKSKKNDVSKCAKKFRSLNTEQRFEKMFKN